MIRNYGNSCRSDIRVLDLGCGTGANTWFLCREGFDVFAFDGSFTAVRKAKDLCLASNGFPALFQADAGIIPVIDSCFDTVVDIGAITSNSTAGIKCILKEIYRVLKPGGRLFSTVLFHRGTSGYGSGTKLDSASFRNLSAGPISGLGTIHFFNRIHIKSLWQKAGFKNLQIDMINRTDGNGSYKISYFMVAAEKTQTNEAKHV
jgi:SAM-dependent methyltransferase